MSRFLIIGSHPHEGEIGEFVSGETPDTIQGMRAADGSFMALFQLHNCAHGTDRCYVKRVNLMTVPESTPKRRRRR